MVKRCPRISMGETQSSLLRGEGALLRVGADCRAGHWVPGFKSPWLEDLR
jgi:hypothetical protein